MKKPASRSPFKLRRSGRKLRLEHPKLGTLFEARLPAGAKVSAHDNAVEVSAKGKLALSGLVTMGEEGRPCRLQSGGGRVVQTGIGDPDTGLNDSIYDPRTDLAIRFEAPQVSISRLDARRFEVALKGKGPLRIEIHPNHLRALCPYLPPERIAVKAPAPSGWLSYYCHFERPTEKAILADLDAAAKLTDHGLSFFLVEAWQRNAKALPVSNFHNEAKYDPEKFPHGMKWLADRIREKGLRPGLWVVTLGTGNEKLYDANPEMFLRDAAGTPIKEWSGRYMFDPTHPAAKRHIRKQLRILAQDWGYEFFKLDGLSGRTDQLCEWLYSLPRVKARFHCKVLDPFREIVELIRAALGPKRYFHACAGNYDGATAGIADGARTGGDVFFSGEAGSWKSIRYAAEVIAQTLFTNRYVWHADPDILSVRSPLSVEEARAWATIFGIT
ncbi:MAG: hypothetical protein V2A58_02620, partial [Planctomycetota bacterium]